MDSYDSDDDICETPEEVDARAELGRIEYELACWRCEDEPDSEEARVAREEALAVKESAEMEELDRVCWGSLAPEDHDSIEACAHRVYERSRDRNDQMRCDIIASNREVFANPQAYDRGVHVRPEYDDQRREDREVVAAEKAARLARAAARAADRRVRVLRAAQAAGEDRR